MTERPLDLAEQLLPKTGAAVAPAPDEFPQLLGVTPDFPSHGEGDFVVHDHERVVEIGSAFELGFHHRIGFVIGTEGRERYPARPGEALGNLAGDGDAGRQERLQALGISFVGDDHVFHAAIDVGGAAIERRAVGHTEATGEQGVRHRVFSSE